MPRVEGIDRYWSPGERLRHLALVIPILFGLCWVDAWIFGTHSTVGKVIAVPMGLGVFRSFWIVLIGSETLDAE